MDCIYPDYEGGFIRGKHSLDKVGYCNVCGQFVDSVKNRPYWYKYYHHYCPVCGREDTYKVRVYDQPRPDDYRERHVSVMDYDWCDIEPYGWI